jgi:hypothetical protein
MCHCQSCQLLFLTYGLIQITDRPTDCHSGSDYCTCLARPYGSDYRSVLAICMVGGYTPFAKVQKHDLN